jgi:hypothetical protein
MASELLTVTAADNDHASQAFDQKLFHQYGKFTGFQLSTGAGKPRGASGGCFGFGGRSGQSMAAATPRGG